MAIDILYHDEHLLVADKPTAVLVVPAPGRRGETVLARLGKQVGARLHAVHRLDEDTTGVLVVARTTAAKAALEPLFRRHQVERIYLALVRRAPQPPAGRIESRLREDARGVVRSVARGGERAVTHYETLAKRLGAALVRCRLETGRRNQIRAHLAELGSPILGDRKYGDRGAASRPLLHAQRIEFRHPLAERQVCVEAAPPAAFREAAQGLLEAP